MEPMEARPIILDVDTGIDDMVALLIAATAPELNLRGVTCVAGNVEINHVARNTATILKLAGRQDVPVSIGAARPLLRRLRTAPETHGPTGTGYVELRDEDKGLKATEFTTVPAPQYFGAHVDRHPGELTVVALRPPPHPEAAEACLADGVIDRIFPLDATQDVVFTLDDLDALPDTSLSAIVRDAIRFYIAFHRESDGIDGCYLHAPVTLIGSLLAPNLVTETVHEALACDTSADLQAAGSLYRWTDGGRPTAEIATIIDADGMKAELLARLARAVAAPAT